MIHRFMPHVQPLSRVDGTTTIEECSSETMLHSASWDFARKFGGPLTNRVLDALEDSEKRRARPKNLYEVIDTRVHMLMPGMYPAIPGWHCDAVYRRDSTSQPEVEKIDKRLLHWTCIIGTSPVSLTSFVVQEVEIDVNPAAVWKSVHQAVAWKNPRCIQLELGDVLMFDSSTIHRAVAANQQGWRFWFRLSFYPRAPMNQIRKQVQVYTTEDGGW